MIFCKIALFSGYLNEYEDIRSQKPNKTSPDIIYGSSYNSFETAEVGYMKEQDPDETLFPWGCCVENKFASPTLLKNIAQFLKLN